MADAVLADQFVELNEYIIKDISNELTKLRIPHEIQTALFNEESLRYTYIEILAPLKASKKFNDDLGKYMKEYKLDELTIDFIKFDSLAPSKYLTSKVGRIDIDIRNVRKMLIDQEFSEVIKYEVRHASFQQNLINNDSDSIYNIYFSWTQKSSLNIQTRHFSNIGAEELYRWTHSHNWSNLGKRKVTDKIFREQHMDKTLALLEENAQRAKQVYQNATEAHRNIQRLNDPDFLPDYSVRLLNESVTLKGQNESISFLIVESRETGAAFKLYIPRKYAEEFELYISFREEFTPTI